MPRVSDTHWLCKPCGRTLERTPENFSKLSARADGLDGYCKECKKKQNAESNPVHNPRRFGKDSTYGSWHGMKMRCQNRHGKDPSYADVQCDPRFETYDGFVAIMGERPPGTSLGRVNDMGNYEPGNCFWMTHEEQLEHAARKRAMKKAAKEAETVNA